MTLKQIKSRMRKIVGVLHTLVWPICTKVEQLASTHAPKDLCYFLRFTVGIGSILIGLQD